MDITSGMSYAYALHQLYKIAKPPASGDDVTRWTVIWVSFAAGELLGFVPKPARWMLPPKNGETPTHGAPISDLFDPH
jgi:hypothetical protein